MSIRIVHLVTSLDIGGAEMMLVRLLGRIDPGRFDNHVICLLRPGELAAPLTSAGIPVATLSLKHGRPNPLALIRLVRLLRQTRPEILQTWMYHADLLGTVAAFFARVPALVWNIRASDVDMSEYGWLSRLTRRLGATLSARPQVVIANSVVGRDAHARLGFQPKRWVVIPNGVDVNQYRPDAAARARVRQSLGLDESAFLIGLVARVDPMKDHQTFLRAAQIMARHDSRIRFVFAGLNADRGNADLLGWIRAGGLDERVHLLGVRRDVAELNAALDLAVMASAFGEGFPNAIAEAMACGIPCVVTSVGDAASLVGPTGWVVPPRDPDAMAAACLEAVSLGRMGRHERGDAARLRIMDAFSLDRVTTMYESLYESVAVQFSDARCGPPARERERPKHGGRAHTR